MAFAASPERPAWQTEDLDEEWVEDDDEDDENNLSNNDISLTTPLATFIQTNSVLENELSQATPSNHGKGTFVVHQSVNHAPLVHQTPGGGLGAKKTNMKNIFSPMPLERMFDPPSPVDLPKPSVPVILESPPTEAPDEIVETDLPDMKSLSTRKFTFSAPRTGFLDPEMKSPGFPMAESTPTPATNAPMNNSEHPLRLFQFQYDTYTREHLSAMVDSIAVNTPSGSTPSPVTFTHALSKVSENSPDQSMLTDLRSAKRVKLSPVSDFQTDGVGMNAVINRPRLYGKDYVGASYSLMQQIKDRDYSTISTVVSAQTGTPDVSRKAISALQSSQAGRKVLGTNNLDSSEAAAAAKANGWSSSRFRQDAAALMAQIKDDMKGKKRVFSTDSQTSFSTVCEENEPPVVSSGLHAAANEHSFRPNLSRSSSRTSSLGSIRTARSPQPSPGQNYSRRGADRELSGQFSRLSMSTSSSREIPRLEVTEPTRQAGDLPPPRRPSNAPPSHPTSSMRLRAEDMNRFVSSSTASGTTLTSGSTQSFAKHPGPAQIRTIAPSDLPSMPDQMGGMMFDKVMMKWVKNTARATETQMDDYLPPEEHSEDPFEDIESLRDESRAAENSVPAVELSRVEEQTEMDDEEAALTSFETDEPSMANIVEVMTGIESGNDTFDSDSFNEEEQESEPLFDLDDESWLPEPSAEEHPGSLRLPGMASPASSHTPSPSRGALVSATPIRSVLKANASAILKEQESRYHTPLTNGRGHRRSVSFSDGKRDGPIRGLHKAGIRSPGSQGSSPGSGDGSPASRGSSAGGGTPSVRSKRLADMMQALQDPEDSPHPGNDSTVSVLQPSPRIVSSSPGDPSRKRVFSRTQSLRASPKSSSINNNANATFLTECSFGVAHDRLVQVITDIEPFEPHWEDLVSVDLSNRNIDSVARLKEFLPRLDSLNLNSNQLSWLSGIPSTLRTLSVASNVISSVTSYHHLKNLESLDISRNGVDSLRQLSCLRHLRELRADGNRIKDLEGLENMQGLMKLSLKGNAIRSADLEQFKWTSLEMLTLSENGLTELSSVASLRSLVILILDDNSLDHLDFEKAMPKLKVLRLSGNKVGKLDVARVPNLRTLYLDNNSLTSMENIHQLTKMENLSLRNQAGRGFNLVTRDIRDVKRLYLSGNPLGSRFLAEACYNLVYVELAACRLSVLPDDLARLIPNVRVLNLNYNFLEDVRPLEGLTRLEKLTVIGSRLKGTKALIRLLEKLPDVEMVDLRMNPCTLGWYLPLLVKDLPGALQPSEQADAGSRHSGWQELDAKFRRDLPDDVYVGRLVYRGMVMRACRRLRLLDGVEVSEKERAKAEKLLVGIRTRHRGSD